LSGLKHFNSQRNHISIDGCNDVIVSGLHIFAPEQSPNTDGIDIAGSTNIQVMNSVIQTGDDCIAINTLCSNINITGVTCGPGHGIRFDIRTKLFKKKSSIHTNNFYDVLIPLDCSACDPQPLD
ncbi:unnamed protein product, partial [Linum tenue]